MIALKTDYHQGFVHLKVTLVDDLWYLSQIVLPGDRIRMKSERKIKIGSDDNAKFIRKYVMLKLNVESVSLHEETLRVKGTIVDGPDDVPRGSYHSFSIGLNNDFSVEKNEWPSYLKKKITDAVDNTATTILIVLYDREQALFSLIRQTGIEHLAEISAQVEKKQFSNSNTESLYPLIVEKLKDYVVQYSPTKIIAGSPSFWKENLEKLLENLKSKTVFISTTNISRSGVNELLSRPELNAVLQSQRLHDEMQFIDRLREKLSKDFVVYGFKDVAFAAQSGAIEDLGVVDHLFTQAKENNSFDQLNTIIKQVDSSQGKVHIVQSDEASKVIDSLGGIAGVLRWKINS